MRKVDMLNEMMQGINYCDNERVIANFMRNKKSWIHGLGRSDVFVV